ncbi:MAG: DUF7507 domain-containing protein, partial [Aquihabitans sp.]
MGRSALVVLLLLASSVVLLGASATLAPPTPAAAAPGTPGVPGAPIPVFSEDFENGMGLTPTILTAYAGDAGNTYGAAAPWLRACNGVIVSQPMPDSQLPATGCNLKTAAQNLEAYRVLRTMAGFLGDLNGTGPDNHLVSAYTDGQNPGANQIEFQTTSPIVFPSALTSRYLTFSVNAIATSCWASGPLYNFSLVNGAGIEVPVAGTIDVCGSGTPVPSDPLFKYGTYTSQGSALFSGTQLGVIMRNANGSGSGNDAAFDDIRVLDVTPQLDKQFDPPIIRSGQTSTLTLTITNTSELGAKTDWGFTDNLPSNVVLASTPNVGGTCTQRAGATFSVTAAPGATSVAVSGGDLQANEVSCTITVDVTSTTAGTYTNGPSNIANTIGLQLPADTTLQVIDPAIDLVKTADRQAYEAGDTITYTFVATNTGADPLSNVSISDPLPGLSALSCTPPSGATLAPGAAMTCTATKVASDADVAAGSIPNTATATGTDLAGQPVTDTAEAIVNAAALSLDKEVGSVTDVNGDGLTNAGDTIAWVFTVTNTGTVPLTGLVVDDPLAGSVTCDVTDLAVGASAHCTADAEYVITTADETAGSVDNVATSSANDPDGDSVASNPDTTTTPTEAAAPALQLEKFVAAPVDVNNSGLTDAGDTLQYTFTVTNTGNVPVSGIVVDDPLAGSVTCDVTDLAVGESAHCTADAVYVITAADEVATSVHNTATSSGTDPVGNPVDSNPDDTTTPVETPAPALGLQKSAGTPVDVNGDGLTDAGDTIQYTFTVTNTGNVPVTGIVVNDPLAGSAT